MRELVRDKILEVIRQFPGITSRELAEKLGKVQPHINQECHVLEMEGKIYRVRPEGARATGNFPVDQPTILKKVPDAPLVSHFRPAPQVRQDERMTVCGYEFSFLQIIEPERDQIGGIKRYYPQDRYENRDNLPLSPYGSGAFCHFSIAAEPVAGVYLWVVDGKIIYIGEAVNLRQRFNSGYGNISPRNCYEGGQNTNCRMNKIVLELCEQGKEIRLYFLPTQRYKAVEKELLGKMKTRYNIKDN